MEKMSNEEAVKRVEEFLGFDESKGTTLEKMWNPEEYEDGMNKIKEDAIKKVKEFLDSNETDETWDIK